MKPCATRGAAERRIARRLLAWYRDRRRDLPWRRTREAYPVWVSETMLQQTRVATVLPYYERFLSAFPDVRRLARASENEVLALWSGLGYYHRARNLHRAARVIVERHDGHFPEDPDSIRALPGVGRYTQGAILSLVHDRPYPVVDGNVARVLARLYALAGDPTRAAYRERLWDLAGVLVPARAPGDFNQALMELGATLCGPRLPRCGECPIRGDCRGHASGEPERFPTRERRTAARPFAVEAALVTSPRGIWLRRRTEGANRGLLEVPAIERPGTLGRRAPGERERRRVRAWLKKLGLGVAEPVLVGRYRHGIMGRAYAVRLWQVALPRARRLSGGDWLAWHRAEAAALTARARRALALARAAGYPRRAPERNSRKSVRKSERGRNPARS